MDGAYGLAPTEAGILRKETPPPTRKPVFVKGFAVALGILGLSLLLLLIPPAGPVLLLTFCPFIACYFGGRMGAEDARRSWLSFGLAVALLWSTVEAALLLTILGAVLGGINPLEPIGLGLVAGLFLLNILFSVFGARRGTADGRAAA